ncbi:hypothetical protein [Leptolyngbya sp. FACHB-261]|uniref:hypothetical protein n=1 Tax=Leptolyngbya sp. FACHB-261 TaxID=2692806 RepID=UPI0016871F04|nr:hypothetical protein [Leptolyngbya sp. FACHB-261]
MPQRFGFSYIKFLVTHFCLMGKGIDYEVQGLTVLGIAHRMGAEQLYPRGLTGLGQR